jgi:hypothetical protein
MEWNATFREVSAGEFNRKLPGTSRVLTLELRRYFSTHETLDSYDSLQGKMVHLLQVFPFDSMDR